VNAMLQSLRDHARRRPTAPALCDDRASLSYAEAGAEVGRLATELAARGSQVAGLLADNSAAWALWDLAALRAGVTLVPLPSFFSAHQLRHVVRDAGVDTLISDGGTRLATVLPSTVTAQPAAPFTVASRGFEIYTLDVPSRSGLPGGIAKITYTSGTTGTPKGVLLSAAAMEGVARSLVEASGAGADDRHLALLPLSTLLENAGGIYAPLLAGGTAVLYPQARVGMHGASELDAGRMLAALTESNATTAILLPQLLQALVAAGEAGIAPPTGLRFLAVGGAPVADRLLHRARALGLPVYEGYGLSECASVVAVNRPGAERAGSVGRPLSHARVRIADDGEIRVGGALFSGYLHDNAVPGEYWPTGDLGRIDEDGYLYVTGRKKNIFITAFGRNVAPEWVEAELTAQPAIAQAAIFGEGQPFNAAVVVPSPAVPAGRGVLAAAIAIAAANAELPDYARIGAWIVADAPFTTINGQATGNGRPRRDAIYAHYDARIAALYAGAEVGA